MEAIVDQIAMMGQKQDLVFHFWAAGFADNELLVDSFSVSESISQITQIEVSLVSELYNIDLHKLIDAPATITVMHKYDDKPRYFSGIIAEASRGEEGHHRTSYQLTVLPAIFRLDHGSDARIWQNKTVIEIIQEILAEYKIKDVEWHISGDRHQKREYCVQYRETHFQFIDRLTREEGIFFYHTSNKEGKHTLHFMNDSRLMPTCEGRETLTHNSISGGNVKGFFCSSWMNNERVVSTHWSQRDYTFKNPGYRQEHTWQAQETNGTVHEYKMYDYPGRYKKDAAGKPFTQHLMESTRVDATTAVGNTNSLHIQAAHKFELTDHTVDRMNIKYMVLSCTYSGSQPGAWQEDAPDDGMTSFNTTFKVMPSRLPYKPPQKTRPVVDGPQMAHVVGPEGEEIYTDEHSRVKISFPWNRHCPKNEKSSCWVRVAQNWAGPKWGHMAIPRIGQEVIVDFLEGDIDQPFISGRTYHAQNQSPYKLPDHKTKMVIRSDSHKAQGYNEISFEDEGGQENMFFHAQKDQTFKVLNNRAKRVEANQTESIGANKNIEVGGNHAEKIGGSLNLSVGGGSGGALMGVLGGILGAGAGTMADGATNVGNAAVTAFAGAATATAGAAEGANLPANQGFNQAGEFFTDAGLEQQGAAATIGGMLSKIMPLSGIVNTIIEKFKSDTIGLARTEQIGLLKSTNVGHTQMTAVGDTQVVRVGKLKQTIVGEEYIIEVGKSKMVMKENGDIAMYGVRFHFEASDHIQHKSAQIDQN